MPGQWNFTSRRVDILPVELRVEFPEAKELRLALGTRILWKITGTSITTNMSRDSQKNNQKSGYGHLTVCTIHTISWPKLGFGGFFLSLTVTISSR